jgi:hypothetical protein
MSTKLDWTPETHDFQAAFQTNLSIWQSAVSLYELNLKQGTEPSEHEFRKCFDIAKELLLADADAEARTTKKGS